jgi:hypothetical protein
MRVLPLKSAAIPKLNSPKKIAKSFKVDTMANPMANRNSQNVCDLFFQEFALLFTHEFDKSISRRAPTGMSPASTAKFLFLHAPMSFDKKTTKLESHDERFSCLMATLLTQSFREISKIHASAVIFFSHNFHDPETTTSAPLFPSNFTSAVPAIFCEKS